MTKEKVLLTSCSLKWMDLEQIPASSYWQLLTVRMYWILHCFVRDVSTGRYRSTNPISKEEKQFSKFTSNQSRFLKHSIYINWLNKLPDLPELISPMYVTKPH